MLRTKQELTPETFKRIMHPEILGYAKLSRGGPIVYLDFIIKRKFRGTIFYHRENKTIRISPDLERFLEKIKEIDDRSIDRLTMA